MIRFLGKEFQLGNWHDDLTDRPILGLKYLYRQYGQQHQYLSICMDGIIFLEAVLFIYPKPFNPRSKTKDKQIPLLATIFRDLEILDVSLNKIYPT